MEYSFIAHKQFVFRSNAIPISFALFGLLLMIIFSIGIGYDDSYLFGSIAILALTSLMWLILFISFRNSYKKITFNELCVGTKKVKIPWESIKKYRIKQIKVRGNVFSPGWKHLDSVLYLYGENGEKIWFACGEEHIDKMKELASGKNKIIDEIIGRIG